MNTIKLYINKLLGLFPQSLPQGVPAFNTYVASLMSTYVLPTSSIDDVKYVIASRILSMGPNTDSASPYSFVKHLRAAGAKQIASNAFQEVRENQKARQLAAEQTQAAATATKAADAQPA